MKLVVGLGNPGAKYDLTRHNVGFILLDLLASRFKWTDQGQKAQGLLTSGELDGHKILGLKPQTFMNLSGQCVAQICRFYKISIDKVIVVHDDIDLDAGRIKFRAGGGHGGHNGIRDMMAHLGSGEFARVKVGVGRPPGNMDVASWVLSRFSDSELASIDREVFDAVLDRIRHFLKALDK